MDWAKTDKRLEIINRRACILRKLRPINLQKERRIFFDSKEYNPNFEYPNIKYQYIDDIVELKAMIFDESPLGMILRNKRDELLKKISLIKSIGTDDISINSIGLYGSLNQKIIKKAESELNNFTKLKDGRRLTFEEIQNIIGFTFDKYNLSDWEVVKRERVADCTRGKNRIFLRPDASFSRERLKKTIAHEIETHIFRKENGILQPLQIMNYGTAGHEFTEEGLAIFNERMVSNKKDEKRFWPAAYTVAVDVAQNGSFRDVFNVMRWYNFSKIRSWVIATKVKRGLKDTSLPGGYTKDYIYFAGKEMIDEHIKTGRNLSDLYLGKIGIDDIPLIKKLPGIKKPKLIPQFIKQYEKDNRSEIS